MRVIIQRNPAIGVGVRGGRAVTAAAIRPLARVLLMALPALLFAFPPEAVAVDLRDAVRRIKPSVVAVGTYQATRRPPASLRGTGFVVADGLHVMTNAHVLPDALEDRHREALGVFIAQGERMEFRPSEKVAEDRVHDIALLRMTGSPLTPLALGNDTAVMEGQSVAFTGFPIAPVLGLHPVTHRGIVSAIAPAAVAPPSPRQLDNRMIRRLEENYPVFQLDATAYPGNSGSPLYDAATGEVIGIVGSVVIKETKEKILRDPSGITYAIPIRHAKALMAGAGLSR